MNIEKKNFFNEYIKNKYIDNETKKTLTKILNLKKEDNNFVYKDKDGIVITDILYNIEVKYEIFDVNFRNSLKEYIRKKYEKRSYYYFYILELDLSVIDKILPLFYLKNDFYNLDIIINTKLKIFKINDILIMNLILKTNEIKKTEDIEIYAANQYIYCKLILDYNSKFVIETSVNKNEIILKKYNKIYYHNDEVQVVLLDFYSNKCLDNFSNKLYCLGKLNN